MHPLQEPHHVRIGPSGGNATCHCSCLPTDCWPASPVSWAARCASLLGSIRGSVDRTVSQTGTGQARHVRLPAAAAFTVDNSGGAQWRGLLLLPDLGTIPVASYRPVLRGLIELAHGLDSGAKHEPLLVVGVAVTAAETTARVAAWHALLRRVAQRSGGESMRARVFAWPQGLANACNQGQRLGSHREQVFALIARHPLLTYAQLATLLGTSSGRIGQLFAQLTGRDWLRAIALADLSHHARAFGSHRRRRTLVELRPAGRREVHADYCSPPPSPPNITVCLAKPPPADASSGSSLTRWAQTRSLWPLFWLRVWRHSAAATRLSKSGAVQRRAHGDASVRTATAAIAAQQPVSDSSWSSTAGRKDRPSTPPSSPATTAIATRAVHP